MSTSDSITFRQYFHAPALAAITASGISLPGIGAAFRGLVASGVTDFVFGKKA